MYARLHWANLKLIPATNWFPFDWHAYGNEAGEADSDKLKQALEDINIKAVILKNVVKMHQHANFLGHAIEHCKATIAAKVQIKRLEDLGSEASERATRDSGSGLLKQCLSFLQAGQTAFKAAQHILATEVPTEELGERLDDPVNGVLDISLTSALSGLDLTSSSDLIKFMCASFITNYKKDIETNLKTVCSGFLEDPWHQGLPQLPEDRVLSEEAEAAILEKGAILQSKVKGKTLLPYLTDLDKDRAKSISVSLSLPLSVRF